MKKGLRLGVGKMLEVTIGGRRRVVVAHARQAVALLWLNVLFALSVAAVVTAGPAAVALHAATRRMNRSQAGVTRAFIGALGHYYFLGWRWLLMNVAAAYVLLASALAYPHMWPGVAGSSMAGVSIGALALWCLVQLFVLPLTLEQEKPRLRTALGNSLVIWLRRPGQSSLLALGVALVASALLAVPVLLSIVLPSAVAYATSQQTAVAVQELAGRHGEATAAD